MRLLKTRISQTAHLELREKFGEDIPSYAILSHTWGEDEVLFDGIGLQTYATKKGYKKLQGCLAEARKDGYSFAWVDTCCIDKSSSAELSESINSMYAWYRYARVCYVYLSDVSMSEDLTLVENQVRNSRYWKRGWTLQELTTIFRSD